ncbi:MAG: carboxypeptidase-like regulatory domain-containing protein [Bacteroidales bacterium]|nr:carboxypeptidase-like regulatory domain-containing protein [Bacteroidales bacterium]
MGYQKREYLSGSLCLAISLFFIFVILSTTLQAQNRLPETRVSVSTKNRNINQILDEITLQTGFYFTYNAALISGKKKVHFNVTDLPLEQALDSLLHDPRFAYRVIDRNIVIYQKNESPPAPLIEEIDRPILKGRIMDSRSGKPLPYTTIALSGTSLGSITNQTGEFSFKLPGDLPDPMLVISYLGYKSMFLPISYPVEKELVIRLKRETIPLQEVIIRFADPALLLAESINRIPGNYLDDHATMTAFYRESVKRNDHCMMYSEAVLDVAKGPYTRYSTNDLVRIRKGRKITDISAEDTVMIKLRSGIYTSLSLDIIKNRPDFLTDDFLNRYDLDFTDMMTYGDRLVYVISFQQKSNIPDLLFRGQLYLDHEHLAILAADFEFNPELIHREPGLFVVKRSPKIHIRPILASYHVDYRVLNGKYHVSQVRAEVEMKVRRRRQWIGARYRISIEMAITDVIPNQQLRINVAERVKPNVVLSDEPFQFDPLFWGIYNTIEPEASLMESLKRIEHNLQEVNE